MSDLYLCACRLCSQTLPYLCPKYSFYYALWSYPGIPYHNAVLSLPFSLVRPSFFSVLFMSNMDRGVIQTCITMLAILLLDDMSFPCIEPDQLTGSLPRIIRG